MNTTDTLTAGSEKLYRGMPLAGWIAVLGVFLAIVVDGMDYQLLNFAYPSLMEEWGLSKTSLGGLGSISLIGLGIGGVLGGWLADRIGRARLMRASLAFFAIFTCMLGFTHSYMQFAVWVWGQFTWWACRWWRNMFRLKIAACSFPPCRRLILLDSYALRCYPDGSYPHGVGGIYLFLVYFRAQ